MITEGPTWALRLIMLLVCGIYVFSAIGKLERTGLGWGSAHNMRLWLLWFAQDPDVAVFRSLGTWMAGSVMVCAMVGAGTVILEWVMPLALFWKRARHVLVLVALGFHVGVLLAMNIHVPEAWLILVLVDWDGLSRRLRRTPATTRQA